MSILGASLEDYCKENFPAIWAKAYPRRYEAVGNYHSPKVLALMAANNYFSAKGRFALPGGYVDTAAAAAYRTLCRLIEFDVPTYFVSPEMLRALAQTDLPDLRICDLKWPMDACLFCLPRGGLQTPDGEATIIGISRHPAKKATIPLQDEGEVTAPSAQALLTTFCVTERGATYAWNHPVNADPVMAGYTDPFFDFHKIGLQDGNIKFSKADLSDAEKSFTAFHSGLAIQLMLCMVARPDLVCHGKQVRAGLPGKPNRAAKPPFWSPNVLGDRYSCKRTASKADEPQGTHYRAHWRRGHWRLYLKGEHWKTTQQVWIEPTYCE